MATTTHLGLTKPLGTDKVRVETLNGNWDVLDDAVFARIQGAAKTVTLPVAGWSATAKTNAVTVTGVGASDAVIVSPAPDSWAAYSKAGVRCTAQAAGALTFTCNSIPTVALTVQVLILKGVTG